MVFNKISLANNVTILVVKYLLKDDESNICTEFVKK